MGRGTPPPSPPATPLAASDGTAKSAACLICGKLHSISGVNITGNAASTSRFRDAELIGLLPIVRFTVLLYNYHDHSYCCRHCCIVSFNVIVTVNVTLGSIDISVVTMWKEGLHVLLLHHTCLRAFGLFVSAPEACGGSRLPGKSGTRAIWRRLGRVGVTCVDRIGAQRQQQGSAAVDVAASPQMLAVTVDAQLGLLIRSTSV